MIRSSVPSARSDPDARAPGILDLERELVSDRYEILRHGGGGAATTLICGAVRFDHPAARNLVAVLPDTIHVEASSSPQLDWMQSNVARPVHHLRMWSIPGTRFPGPMPDRCSNNSPRN